MCEEMRRRGTEMTVDRKWELYEEYLESWVKEIKCTRDKYAKPYSFSEFCDVLMEVKIF